MRFALVLSLAILSFGVTPAKAQQLVVTGQLESAKGSPGGYVVEFYIDKWLMNTSTTNTYGSYTILSKPTTGIVASSLRFSRVICRQPGKYAYSLLDFRPTESGYHADVPPLKLLSTTEARYTPEKARETIQAMVNVEAVLYKVRSGGSHQINVLDAIKVLERTPQAKRRDIVDNLKLDSTLHRDVLDRFVCILRANVLNSGSGLCP